MSSKVVISAEQLGKAYLIYDRPQDRLKQMLFRKRKYYSEYWAVQNVDLRIRRGETVGIIGRNGSGKSTLLQMIAGTLQPNAGSLQVEGRVAPLLELGAGFNPEFTGRENVRLSAAILGLSSSDIMQRENAIIDFSGIGDFVDQPVKSYSSGMFARLAFSVAAHVDAEILIIDEILAVGDASFTQKCMRYIRRFKEHGTVLFVSHDTASINSLCDRAVWMDSGQIRSTGSPRDITLAYQSAVHGEHENAPLSITGRRKTAPSSKRDARHEKLQNSLKRNEIEVFSFDADAPAYGAGGGRISKVWFEDPSGETAVLEGGEEVTLKIVVEAAAPLRQPIIGFYVRDRRGQNLFGDNTFITYQDHPLSVEKGESFEAGFSFQLPYLPEGDYAVTVALADGTQTEHVQHHWLDEALIFRAIGGMHQNGLIGIPMQKIELSRLHT